MYRLLCLILLLTSAMLSAEVNRHAIDFSGNWELDYQLSDHPNEKIRRVYIETRSRIEAQLRRQNNRSIVVDPGVYNLQSIVGLGQLAERIAQATVLDITQADGHIVIQRNDDFSLICDFTDMQPKASLVGAEACAWDEDQLIFRLALPDGLHVEHKLSIAPDRSRLNIATTVWIEGVRYPFTLNRVYMPFEPGEGQYHCEYTIARQTTCTLGGRQE